MKSQVKHKILELARDLLVGIALGYAAGLLAPWRRAPGDPQPAARPTPRPDGETNPDRNGTPAMSTEPTPTMTEVCDALRAAVPGVNPELLRPDDVICDVLPADSLDFLNFVVILSERTGLAVDEDDYPKLVTLAGCEAFVRSRQAALAVGRTS